MSNIKYSDDDFINLIGMCGVMSLDQMMEWQGTKSKRGIEDRLKALAQANNPPIVGRTIPRPWISPHKRSSFILTSFGADIYNRLNNTNIVAPDENTLIANYIHSLGLVDIGFALKKLGMPCAFESRVIIDDQTSEFIRPDVSFQLANNERHVIELERSRSTSGLQDRLLGRLLRWQKAVLNAKIAPDIFVLFSLDKNDNWMMSAWLESLNAFVQKTGEQPAFTVWFLDFKEFLDRPTLDVRRFNKMPVSVHPASFLLAAERERYFAELDAKKFSPDALSNSLALTHEFWKYHWLDLLAVQKSDLVRRAFLDSCDDLYQKNLLIRQHHGDTYNGSIPWLAIETLRFWLEQPIFKSFRAGLIDALREYKSAYNRGVSVAADYLEKIVWESLLYKFEIGRDGPLYFRTRLPDSNTRQKNLPDVIPSFELVAPWAGRDTQEAADQTARALEWLVNMLVLYPAELGLIRENKKPTSSPAAKSASSRQISPDDPFFDDFNSTSDDDFEKANSRFEE